MPVTTCTIPDPDGDFQVFECGDVRLYDDLTIILDGRTLFGLAGDTPRAMEQLRQLRALLNESQVVELLEA
jgi:hypothetical protein